MAKAAARPPKSTSPMPPVSAALPIQLLRARESVMAWFRPHLREHGLTDHQWRVLRALAEADVLEMQELSELCEVQPPSLSRIMPKLVEQKLIQRKNDPDDQRRILAKLTDAGRRLVETVSEGSAEIYQALLETVGPDRLNDLQSGLDELIATLDRARQARGEARERASNQVARLREIGAPPRTPPEDGRPLDT